MIKYGEAPYLECSSKGDKRFSAFYARPTGKIFQGRSIEELYQARKVFEDGSTGLSWKEAKGRKAVNMQDCTEYYSQLWNVYMMQNPDLLDILAKTTGVSDMFGQEGHCCQATELWRIKQELCLL